MKIAVIAVLSICAALGGCAKPAPDEAVEQLKQVNAKLDLMNAQLEETNASLTQLHEDLDGMDTILENMRR